MNKAAFLNELRKRLSGLPQEEAEGRLTFYSEMIDDRIEDGLSETEAVAGIGTADEVAAQILAEIPLSTLVKERVKTGRRLRAWEIVLLVLGSPVWLSLLIAGFAVVLSLFITLWALIASLFAVMLSLAVSTAAGVLLALLYLVRGRPACAGFLIGAALVCAGLAVLLFFGSKASGAGAVRLTKKIPLWLKRLFRGKETDR